MFIVSRDYSSSIFFHAVRMSPYFSQPHKQRSVTQDASSSLVILDGVLSCSLSLLLALGSVPMVAGGLPHLRCRVGHREVVETVILSC
jgi:hypothetical protein